MIVGAYIYLEIREKDEFRSDISKHSGQIITNHGIIQKLISV